MWGSTKANTPDECTWTKAPFNNGSSNYDKAYFKSVKDTVCPNGILAEEYDTATQIMGSDWRMPTDNDFQELLNNTDNAWVDNFKGTGINGRQFTSRSDTSKYIFIPAAGYHLGTSEKYKGDRDYVWSSSLVTSSPRSAWYLYSSSGNDRVDYYDRYYGLSVRGVRK